jgi:hypothetical protein
MLNGTGGQIPCPILSNSPGMCMTLGTENLKGAVPLRFKRVRGRFADSFKYK